MIVYDFSDIDRRLAEIEADYHSDMEPYLVAAVRHFKAVADEIAEELSRVRLQLEIHERPRSP